MPATTATQTHSTPYFQTRGGIRRMSDRRSTEYERGREATSSVTPPCGIGTLRYRPFLLSAGARRTVVTGRRGKLWPPPLDYLHNVPHHPAHALDRGERPRGKVGREDDVVEAEQREVGRRR